MNKFTYIASVAFLSTFVFLIRSANADFTVFAMGPTLFNQATVGSPYSLPLQVSGGTAPYTWSIASGFLPTGLSLDPSSGVISGTPTAETSSAAAIVQVQDSTGATASKEYDIEAYPSVGGLSYTRTPSGNSTPSNISVHVRGVFGADICDNRSTGMIVSVLPADYPGHPSIDQNVFGLSSGAVIDRDFNFTLPLGTYKGVDLFCLGNGVGGVIHLENGNFTALNNRAPVLTPIGNKTVNEGQALSFKLSATDPDSGDTLTYSATNLPSGASFNTATRTFSWTPNFGQAGNYNNVEFTVTDNGTPMMLAFEDIIITVGHVNRAPVINPIGSKQVLEHNTLTFSVSATDPDGNAVTLSAVGMPAGATFTPATGVFTWTPSGSTAGVYTPTFVATDNGTPSTASSSVDVVITVGSNPTPSEQSQTLVNNVAAANLPTGVTNSYLANLNKVGTFIQKGQTNSAINQLNTFIQKVNQDYSHGTITLVQKNAFVAEAQSLIAALQ